MHLYAAAIIYMTCVWLSCLSPPRPWSVIRVLYLYKGCWYKEDTTIWHWKLKSHLNTSDLPFFVINVLLHCRHCVVWWYIICESSSLYIDTPITPLKTLQILVMFNSEIYMILVGRYIKHYRSWSAGFSFGRGSLISQPVLIIYYIYLM